MAWDGYIRVESHDFGYSMGDDGMYFAYFYNDGDKTVKDKSVDGLRRQLLRLVREKLGYRKGCYKDAELRSAYEALRQGHVLRFGDSFRTNIEVYRRKGSRGRDLLFWQHFGSSANECSLKELRWIVKGLANCNSYKYTIVR
jgi:hypothetical protein